MRIVLCLRMFQNITIISIAWPNLWIYRINNRIFIYKLNIFLGRSHECDEWVTMLVGQRNCQIWKRIYPNAGYKRKFACPIRKVSLKATSYLEMFTLESDKYFKHTRCISVVGNWRQDIQADVYEKTIDQSIYRLTQILNVQQNLHFW